MGIVTAGIVYFGLMLLDIHGRSPAGGIGAFGCKIPAFDIRYCHPGCDEVIISMKDLVVDSDARCKRMKVPSVVWCLSRVCLGALGT